MSRRSSLRIHSPTPAVASTPATDHTSTDFLSQTLRKAVAVAALAAGLGAFGAQDAAAQAVSTANSIYPVDVAFTYQAMRRSEAPNGSGHWLNGGSGSVYANFYHGLGIAGDITGEISRNGAGRLNLLVGTFGLRYKASLQHYRLAVFGEALGGESHTYHTSVAGGVGAPDPSNGSAMMVGGGVDLHSHGRLALRVIQADWVRTTLQDGRSNVQNNVRLGAGLVVRLGGTGSK